MTFPTVQEALAQRKRPVVVVFEVQDTDGDWVDLSERFTHDRLVNVGGGLTARQERETGAFDVQLSTITVRNGDRYWDSAPPAAEFVATTWKRLRCRVSLTTLGGTEVLGLFVLDKITTRANNEQATITLKTLTSLLVEAQADRVRQGKQWWIGKSSGFIVRRLLETRHTVAQVAAFSGIQDAYQIPLSEATTEGGPVVSSFARPPETTRAHEIYGEPIAVNNNAADAGYGDLWLGLEDELWKFNAATGVWTYWTVLPTALEALGYKIHRVFVSTLRQKIVALAWVPEFPSANVGADLSGTAGAAIATHSNVVVLTASMTAAPASFTEQTPTVVSNYYTGMFSIRAGRFAPIDALNLPETVIGAPVHGGSTRDSHCAGINMPNPTAHWVRCYNYTPAVVSPSPSTPVAVTDRDLFRMTSWDGKLAAVEDLDMKNRVESLDFWQQENGGYHAYRDDVGATGTYPANYRHNIGQSATAIAFKESSDELVLTVIAWDGAAARYKAKLYVHNIQSATWADSGYYVKTGDRFYLPTSMEFNAAGNKLLVTAHVFKESDWTAATAPLDTGDDEPAGSIVVEFTWPLAAGAFAGQPAQTLQFLSTNFATGDASNRKRWLLLDARYGATGFAGVTFLDYTKVNGAPWGATVLALNGTGDVGDVRWSTGRQSGMVHWNAGAVTAPGALFWEDAGANCIVRANDDGTSTIRVVDDGFSPVDGDNGLAAGLVFSAAHNGGDGALFAISGPGTGSEQDPDVMNPPSPGKFYLYQVAFTMTDRIELADFTGMTVWDALSSIAAIADFVFGYDNTGAFFFRLREAPTSTIATIKARADITAGDVAASEITRDWGYDEIFNYAEVTPSRVILAEPTGSVQLLERPEGWRRLPPWNGSIAVVQKSLLRQKITLRVVEGGKLGSEDDGCVAQDRAGNVMVLTAPGAGERRSKLRLDWLTTDSVIETQLLEPWEAAAAPGVNAYATGRIDAKNLNTGIPQDASSIVHDVARGKVHVAWSGRATSGSHGSHNREVLFASLDSTTGAVGTIVTVEPDQFADLESIDLALMSDGTLLCGYGSYGVRVKESTDGGATWATSTDVDGTLNASTRALAGFIQNAARTRVQIITQERGGGGTQDDVYMRERTGVGTWGTQVKIHNSGSGSSPTLWFQGVARSSSGIGYIVDANVAVLVGSYSNASNQLDQVRALVTADNWATSSTVLIADYTGTAVDRNPILRVGPSGRLHAFWIHGGDAIFAHSDNNGTTWTLDGAPSALAAVPWGVSHDRAFAIDAATGGIFAGAFDTTVGGNLKHHLWRSDADLSAFTDLIETALPHAGDVAGLGGGLIVGTNFWRLYTRLNSGVYEVHVFIESDVVDDPTAGLEIVVPYIAALDTTRGLDETSFLSTVNGELYGDQVEIGAFVGTVRDITHDPTAGKSTILLDHAPADLPYPIGTRVVLRSWENNAWSDGPLGVARTADPSGTVTPGAEGVETDYQAISTRNMAEGMIARPSVLVSAEGDPELLVTEIIDGTTWTGRRVGTGGDADDIPQFQPIRGFLAPVQNPNEFPPGTIFWIGPTDVGLIFEIPDPNAGGVIETPFMVGDEIQIDCGGLTLDEQELTKQIAMDRVSIEKFGVAIFRPARRSPFLNYPRARELSRRVVTDGARPRYVFDVDTPLTMIPKLGDTYLVEDHRILPWTNTLNPQGDAAPVSPDTARGVAATVRSFTLDPINGRAKLTLRAVNPHKF